MLVHTKSKIISVSIRLQDIRNDFYFFHLPDETSESEVIKDKVLENYDSRKGILEGFVDKDRLILQWYPEDVNRQAEQLNREAVKLTKTKNFSEAIKKWEEAISLNEDDVEYLFKLGLIQYEQKNYRESIKYLKKATDICKIHYKAHLILGISLLKVREFDKAEVHVLASNRLNKSNSLTFLNLAAIYSIQKRFNEAIDMFNRTIQISPKETRAYLGLARIYNLLNDAGTSNSYYHKVIELSPGTAMAEYAKRCISSSEKAKSMVAAKQFRENLLSKGIEFYLSANYDLAINQYKKYLKSKPSDAYAWYLLGESKIRSGTVQEAADCFKRAIRLNPQRALYYKTLGIAFHYLGKAKEANDVLKKAINMGKDDPLIYTLLGINLMRIQKFEDAKNYFKMALDLNPNNPLAMYHMAINHMKTNQKDKSKQLLERILSFEFFAPLKEQAQTLLNSMQAEMA